MKDFSREFCKIRKSTFFAEQHQTAASLIIGVSIVLVMKGELGSETVNYGTKTMYQFEPKRNLLRSTLQAKQQVWLAVVRRFLKISQFRKTCV